MQNHTIHLQFVANVLNDLVIETGVIDKRNFGQFLFRCTSGEELSYSLGQIGCVMKAGWYWQTPLRGMASQ